MKILLLGEKCDPFIPIFNKNLDNNWDIKKWKPEDGKDNLIELYKDAEIIVTGFDAMNKGNIFK